jgi:hypothetical protein
LPRRLIDPFQLGQVLASGRPIDHELISRQIYWHIIFPTIEPPGIDEGSLTELGSEHVRIGPLAAHATALLVRAPRTAGVATRLTAGRAAGTARDTDVARWGRAGPRTDSTGVSAPMVEV